MAELYIPLKHSHLMFVAISLLFFASRAVASLLGAQWLQKKWAKVSPHIIDTLLLGTGVALTMAVQQYPLVHHWLTVKIALLVAYIVFGILGMKATVKPKKIMFFGLSFISVIMLLSVARTHNPLGLFSML